MKDFEEPPAIIRAHDELAELAAQINRLHAAVVEAGRRSLDGAIEAGEFLREAKKGCRHGEWKQWVKDNIEVGYDSVKGYMKLARRQDDIARRRDELAKKGMNSLFGVREALDYLAELDRQQAAAGESQELGEQGAEEPEQTMRPVPVEYTRTERTTRPVPIQYGQPDTADEPADEPEEPEDTGGQPQPTTSQRTTGYNPRIIEIHDRVHESLKLRGELSWLIPQDVDALMNTHPRISNEDHVRMRLLKLIRPFLQDSRPVGQQVTAKKFERLYDKAKQQLREEQP